MAQLNVDTAKGGVDSETLLIPVPYLERGGVRSAETVCCSVISASQV